MNSVLSQRIDDLPSEKRQLLLKWFKKDNPNQQSVPPSNTGSVAMTVEELTAEADIYGIICPYVKFEFPDKEPTAIFLTGVTGFIGAFLLEELLQQTQADIYCLVRASDIESGKQRIQKNLESYCIWDESKSSRINPIVGDLSQQFLGLTDEQFKLIAEKIDVIYHCGAQVKWTYPYKFLKPSNVLGTLEIIRLACQSKIKPLHFISTVGVFSSPDYGASIVTEQEHLENSGKIYGGYSQSKWIAEKLVSIAGSRGLPITIHRPNTEGHSKTGVFNKHDHLCKIIKGCIQLGSVPTDLDWIVASAPIDFVSKAIIYLSKQRESLGKVFHLVNPNPIPWNELINLIYDFGYPLKRLDYTVWKKTLMEHIQHHRENELYTLSPLFSDDLLEHVKLPIFDCQNLLDGLKKTSILCPQIDSNLLSTYFSYFVQSGFLKASPVSQK
jgi:thioester reductase-like protein